MAVIVGLAIFVSILLILVVLSQSSKGGISANFIGAGASQMMGVKKTSDILEKLTWGLAIALLVLTLATNFMITEPGEGEQNLSPNIERANEAILPSINANTGAASEEGDEDLLPTEDAAEQGASEEEGSDDLGL